MGCYCDYDQPAFYSATVRTAKKQHKCCECGHTIEPGEKYENVAGKWDGRIGSYHTCEACADLRDSLADSGGCFYHGGLNDEYYEYLSSVFIGTDTDADDVHRRVMAKHRAGSNAQLQGPGGSLPGPAASES